MIRDILGTSRFLIILAVLGTFIASATLQVFGLLRVAAVIAELIRVGEVSSAASKSLIADTVAIIDIFLIGTVLFVISAGLYQLFVRTDVALPGWLTIESLDDLKENLTEVIVVALLVAFLGQAIEWTGDVAILGLGLATAAVIVAVGILTWVSRRHPTLDAGTTVPKREWPRLRSRLPVSTARPADPGYHALRPASVPIACSGGGAIRRPGPLPPALSAARAA